MLLLFLIYHINSFEALGVIKKELQVLKGRVATPGLSTRCSSILANNDQQKPATKVRN
jgi:hypothetical protein